MKGAFVFSLIYSENRCFDFDSINQKNQKPFEIQPHKDKWKRVKGLSKNL